jgi:hypothetical protein
MSTVPANQRRYSTVVAIEAIPNPDILKYRDIVERLTCGHLGANHGATWEGTDAPLGRRPEHYTSLIGRRRQCKTCSADATKLVWKAWQGGIV